VLSLHNQHLKKKKVVGELSSTNTQPNNRNSSLVLNIFLHQTITNIFLSAHNQYAKNKILELENNVKPSTMQNPTKDHFQFQISCWITSSP